MDVSLENIIVIGVAAFVTVALLLLIRWLVPRYVGRFLHRVDNVIPADLSDYVGPTSRFVVWVLGLMILLSAGFTVGSQLGADFSGLLERAESAGREVGRWLGTRVLAIGVIAILAVAVIRVVNHVTIPLIQRYLARRADASEQPEEVDKRTRTLQGVVSKTFSVIVIVIAFFMVLAELGINIAPLLAGAGVIGIAIGLGAQSLIRDFISGVFILLEDQYRVGDVVRVAGVAGLVEDINLRRTTLRDLDYIQHIIPNGEIRVASNFTKEKSRVNLNIQVAYKEDLDRVMEVIRKVGEELAQDPEFAPLIVDPIKPLRVDAFEDSGIAIKVLGETKPIQQWTVAGEFRRRLKRAFDEEGIEIPFPHRTLYWGPGEETRVRQLRELQEEENRRVEEQAALGDDGTGEG